VEADAGCAQRTNDADMGRPFRTAAAESQTDARHRLDPWCRSLRQRIQSPCGRKLRWVFGEDGLHGFFSKPFATGEMELCCTYPCEGCFVTLSRKNFVRNTFFRRFVIAHAMPGSKETKAAIATNPS